MVTLFKILTPIFGIVAVVSLIGLTDTTHQVFGPDDAMVVAVALVCSCSQVSHGCKPPEPSTRPAPISR